MKNTHTICVPFSGFYETDHNLLLDVTEQSWFSDDIGSLVYDTLYKKFTQVCDYAHAFNGYSRLYTQGFADKFELTTLKFESLDSPLEYNFTTDRIFCTIGESEIERMFKECPPELLTQYALARHTSYDGFSSSYDPDYITWGDVLTWDHNQLETLLTAWISTNQFDNLGENNTWSSDDQTEMMQEYACNGYVGDLLLHDKKALRLVKIAYYLRCRSERNYEYTI